MRVAALRWSRFRIPFRAPYETAHGAASHREGVIVRLLTDAGLEGLGEASLDPAAPAGAAGIGDRLDAVAPRLQGRPLTDAMSELDRRPSADEAGRAARFALETAVRDVAAKAAEQRLAACLVPGSRSAVAVNATIASCPTETAVRAAAAACEAGFGTVKLKVGLERTPTAEAARVGAVRASIGAGVRLRLDANGAWDEATAIDTIRALANHDIELVEQPVPPDDVAALGRVRAAVETPVAADEAVVDLAAARAIIAAGAADVLVLKPMRLGFDATLAIVVAAAAAGVAVVVTTTIDTGVATAAALHLAATLPEAGPAHGLATAPLLEVDLLREPLNVTRGRMTLPPGPGLGIELDEALLARYAVGEEGVP